MVIEVLLIILAAYLWLALVGGCEDYNPTGCHPSYGWMFWIALAAALLVLFQLILRLVDRPSRRDRR